MIHEFTTQDADFDTKLDALLSWTSVADKDLTDTVDSIIHTVAEQGDQALVDYTANLDNYSVNDISELIVSDHDLIDALKNISSDERLALQVASERIKAYHQHQVIESWQYTEESGTVLGQKVTPMDRVGIYVPGGKASYPSSVLMNAIPAKVAGVEDITMVVPAPGGQLNPLVLAAAHIADVDQVITIGGAQAIAALAYGTESILPVDKIVGPGNAYVAAAKRAVFGRVAIDMIAGPSEILVVADGTTPADWVAMDLFSQAEHDEQAQSIFITTNADYLAEVKRSLSNLLPSLERSDIVRTSLKNRGALILADNDQTVFDLINRIAPEHLELSVKDPEAYLPHIRHAGAIFMGAYSAEAMGDYCAGPNHVLPTSGTARFSSPLGVYDFQKRSSIIYPSKEGAHELAALASVMARGESLEAHARSAEYRLNNII